MYVREQLVHCEYLIIPHLDSDGSRQGPRGIYNFALDRLPSARAVLPVSDVARRTSICHLQKIKITIKIKSAGIPASLETHLL